MVAPKHLQVVPKPKKKPKDTSLAQYNLTWNQLRMLGKMIELPGYMTCQHHHNGSTVSALYSRDYIQPVENPPDDKNIWFELTKAGVRAWSVETGNHPLRNHYYVRRNKFSL